MSEAPGAPKNLTGLAMKNGIMALLARSSSLLAGILLTPIVLGRLGQDLYGVVAATSSTFDYLILLRGGLGEAMRRHVTVRLHSGAKEEAGRYYAAGFWWGVVLRTVLLAVGIAVARPLCGFLNLGEGYLPDAAIGIALLFFSAVLADAGAMFEVPVYATGRLAVLSALRAVTPWMRIGVIVLAFRYLASGLTQYSTALIVVEAVSLLAIGLLAQRTRTVPAVVPAPSFGDPKIRTDLFTYGGTFLVAQLAVLLYLSTDNLLIGRFYGPAAVTLYSLGTRWAPMIRSFLWALIQPTMPLFTQLQAHGETERTRAAIRRACAISSALAVPICLVPCVVGDLFLEHWVGAEYRTAASYMVAMLAPMCLEMGLQPVWTAMMGRGRVGWFAAGDILVAVCNVLLSLVLALGFKLGLLGFALGNTAALLAKNLILRPIAARREAAVPSSASLLKLLLLALLGGAPALLALYATRDLYGGSLAGVVAAGTAAGLLALLGSALLAIGRRDLMEYWQVFSRRMRRA